MLNQSHNESGSSDLKKLPLAVLLGTRYPIIMAPMFLVSNEEMIISAFKAGISAAIPALNYRTEIELRFGIRRLKEGSVGSFGINLIVNKSNLRYPAQLKVCCEEHVNFIITSLGSPLATIKEAKNSGIKVFCDVTDIEHAKKVEQLGADAIIAVNNRAGGHAGNLSPEDLIVKLKSSCSIPIISAGGVGCGSEMKKLVSLGADGFSIGSIFIASTESGVSEEYKRACVDYGARDIVMTTKLSGTPCTVINTPYVQKIGTQQTWIERVLNKNKRLKKWFKAFTFYKGIKSLEKAAFSATYKNVWCAGPSIEHVKEILPVEEIVRKLIDKYNEA